MIVNVCEQAREEEGVRVVGSTIITRRFHGETQPGWLPDHTQVPYRWEADWEILSLDVSVGNTSGGAVHVGIFPYSYLAAYISISYIGPFVTLVYLVHLLSILQAQLQLLYTALYSPGLGVFQFGNPVSRRCSTL